MKGSTEAIQRNKDKENKTENRLKELVNLDTHISLKRKAISNYK